jgi:hypothetical protein
MATVLLTMEDVDSWREELRKLTSQAADINKRIGDLQKKLADAQPFVTSAVSERLAKAAQGERQTYFVMNNVELPPNSMFEAVRAILLKVPALEPKDIAKTIIDDPSFPDKIRNSHPNYLYTALKRMTDRGLLVRDSQGRYSVPKTNEAAAE